MKTRQELLDEIYELRKKIAEFKIEIRGLINVDEYIQPPIFREPFVYPFIHDKADGTGDPLPVRPLFTSIEINNIIKKNLGEVR